jgi:hypothetical protein
VVTTLLPTAQPLRIGAVDATSIQHALNDEDPEGLLKLGAPADEYQSEAELIADLMVHVCGYTGRGVGTQARLVLASSTKDQTTASIFVTGRITDKSPRPMIAGLLQI